MRHFLFLLLTTICTAGFSQKKTVKNPLAGIEKELEQILNDRKAAGFAVAVVKKDSIIYAKGFGYRDYENKLPVTPNTLFAIGSCTKAFTASLLGLMNKEGKIEPDKPVTKYLPGLRFFNDELNNKATVRDIIVHRTGLPRHDYSWYLFPTASRDSLLKRIAFLEPTEPLRQNWQYNNFMYLVQGMIAEKHYEKTWEQLIQEHLFEPLEMKRSNTSISDLTKDNDAALGYLLYKDSIIKKAAYYNINAMGPAGSINSSVLEMANWVKTWINGGKYKGTEVLPAQYVSEAISSQMVASPGLPNLEIPELQFSNYGFGWSLSSYRGHYRVEHGGNIDGFSASTAFYPTDSIGIIVLTNQNGSSLNSVVRNTITDRLLNLTPINWNKRTNEAQAKAKEAENAAKESISSNKKTGTYPSHSLSDYTGLYTHPGYGTIDISLEKDSLIARFPIEKVWLKHYHYDIFEAYGYDKETGLDTTSSSGLLFPFQMSKEGDIISLTLDIQPGLDPLIFTRANKALSISSNELEKYTGEYELAPGALAKVYTKGEVLYVFIEGQPEYELVPVGEHKFDIKVLNGFTLLFEETNQEIKSVSFIQPNGTFKASKK